MGGRGLTGYRDQGMPVQRRRWSTAIGVLVAWLLVASCGGAEAPSTEVGSTDIAVTTTGASTTTVDVTEAAAGSTVEDDGQPDEVVEDDLGVVDVDVGSDEPDGGVPDPTVDETAGTSGPADGASADVDAEAEVRADSADAEAEVRADTAGGVGGGELDFEGLVRSSSGDLRACFIRVLSLGVFEELQVQLTSPDQQNQMRPCLDGDPSLVEGRADQVAEVDRGGGQSDDRPDGDAGSAEQPTPTIGPDGFPLVYVSDASTPAGPPVGRVEARLGPVVLSSFSPASITALEDSTNVYIEAVNEGTSTVTIQGPRGWEVLVQSVEGLPAAPTHFFDLDPFAAIIQPGRKVTFEFMITRTSPVTDLTFPFRLVATAETTDLTVRMLTGGGEEGYAGLSESVLPLGSQIRGTVTDGSGAPLAGAEVGAYPLEDLGHIDWRTTTDSNGRYHISVPTTGDLEAYLGSRPLPYPLIGYRVEVNLDGYTADHGEVRSAVRGEAVTVNLSIMAAGPVGYDLVGEVNTGGVHGIWWIRPLPGFNAVVTVEGRHPPELPEGGQVVAVDLEGRELWRFETARECWSMDVSADGDVAVACHDGAVHLLDSSGNLQWSVDSGGMNRMVRFDPGGTRLVTGPGDGADVIVRDSTTGAPIWSYDPDPEIGWLRHAVWSPDGQRLVTGHSGGLVVMFDRSGTLLWERSIGEFPMSMGVDASYSVFAAGKNRELFSFDGDGLLRFRHRISNHVVSAARRNMSDAGDRFAHGTVGGVLQVFDQTGAMVWQRRLGGVLLGHNALDMTSDGSLIVAGSAGEAGRDGYLELFDRNGALLWQTRHGDGRDAGTIPMPYSIDHNQRGVISVAISDDGRRIVAGYGDSTIRIFERRP